MEKLPRSHVNYLSLKEEAWPFNFHNLDAKEKEKHFNAHTLTFNNEGHWVG